MTLNSRAELSISIAGMPVTLSLSHLAEPRREQIAERYADFAVRQDQPIPVVDLISEPGPPFIPFKPGSVWQIQTFQRNGRLEFRSHLEEGWIDRATGYGMLVLRPEGNPENFLRVLYAWLCLEHEALVLHAAGVIRAGRGYVFFGASGSGKTTITQLSLHHTILSDDLVIIKRHGDTVRVYGVPFRGDLPEAPRTNVSADLSGLFMLVQDTHHHITTVAQGEAVARLSACVPFVMADPANAAQVMALCASIEECLPVRALHFRRDPEFWKVIDGA